MSLRSSNALAAVASVLSLRYRDVSHRNRRNPFEELLFILCSLQTNEPLYWSTFAALRRAFPQFDMLATARTAEITKVLRRGGLANQKAKVISVIAKRLRARFGGVTLAPLRKMSTLECEEFLTALPGVGKKTARCVLLYALGRPVFPVDVHCWRICRRMGWVRPKRRNGSCSPADMDRLQNTVPVDLRFGLHVNLVSLGRDTCTVTRPKCSECVVKSHCQRIGVKDGR